MGRKRSHIRASEKIACALAELLPAEVRNELRKRKAPADEILSMFEWHHVIKHEDGGPDLWWNLSPLRPEPHKKETKRQAREKAQSDRYRRLEETGTKRTPAQQRKHQKIKTSGFCGWRKFNGDKVWK